jgi:hypothetical protein
MLYPFELRALGVPRLFYPQSELSQTGRTGRTVEIGYCRVMRMVGAVGLNLLPLNLFKHLRD